MKLISCLIFLILLANCADSLKRVIIDTDAYNDDARALILAFRQPKSKFRILAITTVAGSLPINQTVANVNRLRRLVRRADVPIYAGASTSLLNDPERLDIDKVGSDGFGDKPDLYPPLRSNDYKAALKHHAALSLIRLARKHPKQITLITLGPLTNVALALRLDPSFASNLRELYMMGGNYLAIGNLGTWKGRPTAEFNIFLDPEAAETVLMDMRVPIFILPWETAAMYSNYSQWQFLRKTPGSFDYSIFYKNNNVSKFLYGITESVLNTEDLYIAYIDEVTVAAAFYPRRVIKTKMRFNSVNIELRGPLSRGQMLVSWLDYGKKHPYQNITFITDYHFPVMPQLLRRAVS